MAIFDYTPHGSSDEMLTKLKKTVFAVEADYFSQHVLWEKYSLEAGKYFRDSPLKDRLVWKQDNSGVVPTIGQFNGGGRSKYRVSMSLLWADINGHSVLFYHQTSRYQDHDLSRQWLFKHAPQLFPNGIDSVANLTDATNFHICMHHLARLNKS